MPRRLEIELTSERPDGTWTWRAAGAKQPKGELDGGVLPGGAKVGDVLRADAEFLIDGIEITAVLPPKGARKEPERIEITGSGREEPLVTTQLVQRGRGIARVGDETVTATPTVGSGATVEAASAIDRSGATDLGGRAPRSPSVRGRSACARDAPIATP